MIPWLLLRAVPRPPLFRTRPRSTWPQVPRPQGRAPRSTRGSGFLERSSPGPSQARDCSHLHSSRASPSQRKAWWALVTAWQLSGTLAPAPSGCFTPRLAFCCWCKPAAPEPAQLGAGGRGGASWMGTQPMGVGWGEPSWPPAWPEQLGLDGRKGGYLQLPQAGVGQEHHGPQGACRAPRPHHLGAAAGSQGSPWPGPAPRSALKNPRWRAAEDRHGDGRPAEGPLSVPASCRPLWAEACGKCHRPTVAEAHPPPLPEAWGPCCFQGRGVQCLGSWL